MCNAYEQTDRAVLDGTEVSPAYLSCKSSVKTKMSTKDWWNGTDRGKLKYWERNII